MHKGKRLFSSFSFWIDTGNTALWRQLLKWLLALDCARCEGFSMSGNSCHITGTCSNNKVAYNRWTAWIVLQPFFQLHKAGLTCIHSPSNTVGSLRLPKTGKQTHWEAKETSNAFYWYLQARVSGKWYTVHLSWNEQPLVLRHSDLDTLWLVQR